MWSIAATCMISMLIALINIGSTEALINIIGFITAAWLAATLIPLVLLFWRRTTGAITPFIGAEGTFYTIDVDHLHWGSWRMSEPVGTIVNGFAIAWNITMLVFSTFPISLPVTAENMNYSSLMTGFWILFSLVYYFVWGRKVCHLINFITSAAANYRASRTKALFLTSRPYNTGLLIANMKRQVFFLYLKSSSIDRSLNINGSILRII